MDSGLAPEPAIGPAHFGPDPLGAPRNDEGVAIRRASQRGNTPGAASSASASNAPSASATGENERR
jgi:hypothetical protein